MSGETQYLVECENHFYRIFSPICLRKVIIKWRQYSTYILLGIANPQIFTKYCTSLSQNNPKSCLLNYFLFCTNLIQSIKCSICKDKKYVFAHLQKFEIAKKVWDCKSQILKLLLGNPKKMGPQIANLQNATFAEGPQIYQII